MARTNPIEAEDLDEIEEALDEEEIEEDEEPIRKPKQLVPVKAPQPKQVPVQVVEREVTLSLINEKLNIIINALVKG